MRVAVADIGTNSCHLLIAQSTGSNYRVLDSLKERTRLGECLEGGLLTPEGEERLRLALARFGQLAQAAGVQEVRAYATSAMRQAGNGQEVAQRMQEATGIYPIIISGEREGQLTYLGAAHSVEFGPDNLLLDLGGGSLELARGGKQAAEQVVSLSIGSVTMNRQYLAHPTGKVGREALKKLQGAVREAVKPHKAAFGVGKGTRVFGSSGTFEAVAAAIAQRQTTPRQGLTQYTEDTISGYSFTTSALSEFLREMQKLDTPGRIKAGIDPKRADIIVAGAAILETALLELGASTVTVSSGALREGMLIEELALQERWREGLSLRQQSAIDLAERFQVSLPHARQVTALARDLLGRLQRRGVELGDEAASLLSAAAFLHEVGQAVSQSSHHKHSAYLIRHGGLRGFDARQTELIAQIARYHRKGLPRTAHPEYQALDSEDRRLVAQLGAVLRVADGLDRSHAGQSVITDLHRDGENWILSVRGATPLDLSGVREKADLWRQVYGPLVVEEAGEVEGW